MRFEGERWDYRKQSPQAYLRLPGIATLLSASYGNYFERARSALSRLEAWPAVLAQGKANLERPPRLWTEAAIQEAEASLQTLDSLEPSFRLTYEMNPENEFQVKARFRTPRLRSRITRGTSKPTCCPDPMGSSPSGAGFRLSSEESPFPDLEQLQTPAFGRRHSRRRRRI